MRSLPFLLLAGFSLALITGAVASYIGLGSYDTSDYAQDVAVAGDYAYVADGNSGLVVVDVSDPTNPYRVGRWDTSGYAMGVAVANGYAYVADGNNGLVIMDVSDPTNPYWVGSYDTSGYAIGVAVSGDYTYVADGSRGLVVVNISDPTDPTGTGSYNSDGYSMGVAVANGYAYVADGYNGIMVVNVSDPNNLTYAASYAEDTSNAHGVAVSGGYAYLADGNDGLVVLDVSDPTDPTLLRSYGTSDAHGVAVSGGYAYLADGNNGLVVVDVSDPTNLTWAGSYNSYGYSLGVAVANGHVYVADGSGGLVMSGLDSDNDGIIDSLDAFPNDPDEQFDTDGDGVGDNSDSFPETALFKSWWGPGLIIVIIVVGGNMLAISTRNKRILDEAETILEELESKGGDVAPARKLIDKAQNFIWSFPILSSRNPYFGVWDPLGKPRAERARREAGELSFQHDKIQEEIDVVDKILKGFDKDGVDVSLSMTKMELAQTALSEGKFTEAWERLASAKSIGSKLKEEYVESMKKIDQIKTKIKEFKEKGVNTDELEKILKKAEKGVKK